MPKKQKLSTSAHILLYLFAAVDLLPRPFEGKGGYAKRQVYGDASYRTYLNVMTWLEDKGFIKIYKDVENKKLVKLTKKGQLEALFTKARLIGPAEKWDGKWSMIIFDIPEEAREKRHLLRSLLRANSLTALQQSVFVSPYPLNREAVEFLRQTKLNEFIRIIRVDAIDDDKDLKKKFNLK